MRVIPLDSQKRIATRVAATDEGAAERARAYDHAEQFVKAATEAAADLAVKMFFSDAPAAEQRLLRSDLLL
jgi:hypothetical protein